MIVVSTISYKNVLLKKLITADNATYDTNYWENDDANILYAAPLPTSHPQLESVHSAPDTYDYATQGPNEELQVCYRCWVMAQSVCSIIIAY